MTTPITKEEYERQCERVRNDPRYPPALKRWQLDVLEIMHTAESEEERERRIAELSDARRFERQQERVRARLRTVAGRNGHVRETEHGTVRTDLAAFAALLLSVALVGAAIWAASGWWG